MKISTIAAIGFGLGLLTSSAFGSTINVVATSTGCFFTVGNTCTPIAAPTVGGLTFTGASISGNTTFTSSLGLFQISDLPYDYSGISFDLLVEFTSPVDAADADYTAVLAGKINDQGNGVLKITFDAPTSVSTNFSGGSLTVALNDASYTLNSALIDSVASEGPGNPNVADLNSASISATITSSGTPTNPTPEPGTLVLLGTGASLVALSRLKTFRRKA